MKGGLDPAMFGSVNSLFIIALTPILLILWKRLRERGQEPSTPAKLGLGMLLVALSCAVMMLASLAGGDHGRVSALWLVGSYFVATLGELCLSPMGLSMVTKLAPRKAVALMLGFWYLATAIGNKMAGNIGGYWEVWSHSKFFAVLTLGSLGAAAALALNLKRLRAAMPQEKPAASGSVVAVVTVAAIAEELAAAEARAAEEKAAPVLTPSTARPLPS